ncbi:uncharacterized protein LOC127848840 [Dreissena polymorpha]|uniref:Cadherin domain-containing protein n=1 Tax=Dreissena polymorpha TaxID=45954 RepID=A0A9D4DDJ0_DREPO|nr:uncharacterized protein LOC127848840 [Dreissena polymorpha]KAH3746668.1 hypothetical protein DPMN_181078 [Dreissena polymorpha]
MDKVLGLLCALLFVGYIEAAITAWTGKAFGGPITVTGDAPDGAGTIMPTLSTSTAVGATLFTLTATAGTAIASYTFHTTDGNPGTHGAIAMSGTSGVVTLAKAIEYPTVKQLIFKVVANDSTQGTALTGTFTMTVNFGPSTDNVYSFCVADPTASGTVIGKPTSSVSTGVWTITTGTDAAKFTIADGSIKTAAKLESSDKVFYMATLTLTDGTVSTTPWPLYVLVDNSCLSSEGVQVIACVVTIVMTVFAYIVM